MKKCLLLILTLIWSVTLSAQSIEASVKQQLDAYPESRLLDIYKSCFQDYMGAEHLVTNRKQVEDYLDSELQTADELQEEYYESCGIDGRHVRVSIKSVKDGLISKEMLLDAFVRSANSAKRPSVGSWKKTWKKMIRKIDKMKLDLKEYEQDKRTIKETLEQGEYALSHSPEYRNAYHPHYRIIEKSIFEKEIKPLLDKDLNLSTRSSKKKNVDEHSPSVIIVMYDQEVGKEHLLKAVIKYKAEVVYDYNFISGMAIKKPADKTLEETMAYFKKVKAVLTVEYDRVIHLTDPVRPKLEIQ